MFCGPCLPAAATKAATHSETAAACGPEVIRAIVLEDSLCLLHGLWRGKARELRPAGSGQRLACEQPVAVGRWFCCGSPLPLSLRCQQRVPPTDRTRTGGGATGGGGCGYTSRAVVYVATIDCDQWQWPQSSGRWLYLEGLVVRPALLADRGAGDSGGQSRPACPTPPRGDGVRLVEDGHGEQSWATRGDETRWSTPR